MKKLFLSIIPFLSLLLVVSCVELSGLGTEYTVSFSVDGAVTETVQSGEIETPRDPEKDGYIFCGWFYDEECTMPLGAYDEVERDVTLYAGFLPDYEAIVNSAAKTAVKANVTVYSTSYNTGIFGNVTSEVSANGSGIIFKETATFYYCLTNCHVVERREGYSYVKFSITDCYENSYNGVTVVAQNPDYDLAVLRFEKSSTALRVISLAESIPDIGGTVVAITQPRGQKNTVTLGEYKKLDNATVGDGGSGSNVTFSVMYHTAPVDHGSSGGALLNERLELVGVNYAIVTEKDSGDFLAGLAIPIDRVKEFLSVISY